MITDEGKRIKAEAYARHIARLSLRRRIRESEIEALRGELGLVSSVTGEKVSASPSPDAVLNAVIKIQQLLDEYEQDVETYVDELRDFALRVDRLDARQARVLIAWYVNGASWNEIFREKQCSRRTVYRLRDAGLVALYDEMPEAWRSEIVPDASDLGFDTTWHSKTC